MHMTEERCIFVLKGCMRLLLSDSSTGEVIVPERLDDLSRMTYEVMKTVVELYEKN